jgi:hypothetical protein
MAMLEFTHCISQYYPNTEDKYVQKQKQTLLLLFIYLQYRLVKPANFNLSVCILRKKCGKEFPSSFFILQAKFSLAQVATKNKIFLMNRSTKEKGSSETLNCFHSSLNFGQWMAKLKHLGALPINLFGENCTLISYEGEVIPQGYPSTGYCGSGSLFSL